LAHCGQLILGKISKRDATRCQILRLNAQNSISAGDAFQTPPWSLQRSPRPSAWISGPTSKGMEEEKGEEKEEEGRREWKGDKGRSQAPKHFGLESTPFSKTAALN